MLAATDNIDATYEANWIVSAGSGQTPLVSRSERSTIANANEGQAFADARLDLYRHPEEALKAVLTLDANLHIGDGDGLCVDPDLLGDLGIEDIDLYDVWIVDEVEIESVGDLLRYTARLLRRQHESRYLAVWRRWLSPDVERV